LTYGEYLIALIGTDCKHCQDAVPELNALAGNFDLPEVLALCPDEESACMEFVDEFLPIFPIGHVSEADFWELLGEGISPRILLVSDGHIQRAWDGEVPRADEILSTS
jgi:hypothetical protein